MTPLVDLTEYKSALVLKPSSLGDIVHTLPAVHAIKRAHPHLKFRWLCNTEWTPLLEGNADLDEVIPFPRREFRGLTGLPAALKWARKLNKAPREVPEIALDFQGLLRSGLIAFARGVQKAVGMDDAREGAARFHHHSVAVDREAHSVERYLEVARALGVAMSEDEVTFPLPQGTAPKDFKLPRNFLLLHPYARGGGKSLSDEVIQSLCDCLSPRSIIVVGRTFHERVPSAAHVSSMVNKTSLLELIWLIRQARGIISVDSGPMHLAAAVTDRTIGIHTWSDPRKVGPFNPQAWVWKAGRIAHRTDFSDDEAKTDQPLTHADARRTADFVLREWF